MLAPKDVIVTINGSDFTTQIFNYSDNQGRKNATYSKTFNRNFRKNYPPPTDMAVTFDITPEGNQELINVWENHYHDDIPIVLTWPTKVITYNNSTPQVINYSMSADGRLVANMEFSLPFFDNSGAMNRVITS